MEDVKAPIPQERGGLILQNPREKLLAKLRGFAETTEIQLAAEKSAAMEAKRRAKLQEASERARERLQKREQGIAAAKRGFAITFVKICAKRHWRLGQLKGLTDHELDELARVLYEQSRSAGYAELAKMSPLFLIPLIGQLAMLISIFEIFGKSPTMREEFFQPWLVYRRLYKKLRKFYGERLVPHEIIRQELDTAEVPSSS